jgi:hypothetical protein
MLASELRRIASKRSHATPYRGPCVPWRQTQERTKSQFLRYEDADNRCADFHALRHTYTSQIVASGASTETAQTLTRLRTAELAIGRYSHARGYDLQGAVEGLPGLPCTQPQQAEQAKELCGWGVAVRCPDFFTRMVWQHQPVQRRE